MGQFTQNEHLVIIKFKLMYEFLSPTEHKKNIVE